jgi:type VI secretion system Hcp family effector
MAVNVFLTLASGQTKFQGTVEVKSFTWGVENTSTPGSATGGAGAGKAKFQDAVISKEVDAKVSPVLFQLLTQGEHLDGVTIEFRKSGGAPGPAGPTGEAWITLKLSMVFVTQLEQSVSTGDQSPTEVVHLSYGAANMLINGQDSQGKVTSGTSVTWNQITNSNQITNPAIP